MTSTFELPKNWRNRNNEKRKKEYCTCEQVTGSSTQMDDFGYWEVCNICGKPIEESYVYFNHYDGEDQDYDGINN